MSIKSFLLSAIVPLCTGITSVAAQSTSIDQKYIEVTISDSAEINPDMIEYKLKLMSEANIDDYAEVAVEDDDYTTPPVNNNYADVLKKKQEESALKLKMLEKRFSDFLSKEKVSFTREDDNAYYNLYAYGDYNYQAPPKSFVLKFTSFVQMNKFLEKIPEDIKYSGNVSNIASSKQREEEAKLLERALISSRKQALNIATLSGVKLGQVVQFSDNEGDNLVKGLERLIYSIPKMYEREKYFGSVKKIIIMKTVRVRYSIE